MKYEQGLSQEQLAEKGLSYANSRNITVLYKLHTADGLPSVETDSVSLCYPDGTHAMMSLKEFLEKFDPVAPAITQP